MNKEKMSNMNGRIEAEQELIAINNNSILDKIKLQKRLDIINSELDIMRERELKLLGKSSKRAVVSGKIDRLSKEKMDIIILLDNPENISLIELEKQNIERGYLIRQYKIENNQEIREAKFKGHYNQGRRE